MQFLLNLFGAKKSFATITASLSRMVAELEEHTNVQLDIVEEAEAAAAFARTEIDKAKAAARLKELLG